MAKNTKSAKTINRCRRCKVASGFFLPPWEKARSATAVICREDRPVVSVAKLEDPKMSSALHDLSERWFQAWLERDATTVERMAADDYIYVAPNGVILDRQAILAIIHSPSYRLDHGRRTEVVVRAVGHDAAVVRHRYMGAGSFEGTSFTDDQQCVMVWEKQAGEWRLVMEQCSFSGK